MEEIPKGERYLPELDPELQELFDSLPTRNPDILHRLLMIEFFSRPMSESMEARITEAFEGEKN